MVLEKKKKLANYKQELLMANISCMIGTKNGHFLHDPPHIIPRK